MSVREGHPELDAGEPAAVPRGRLLRVRDAVARGHDVDPARPKGRVVAESVVVDDLAVENPAHGLDADVGMGAHVHGLAAGETERAEAVEEAPGPDHAPPPDGKGAVDGQSGEPRFMARMGLERRAGHAGRCCHREALPNSDPGGLAEDRGPGGVTRRGLEGLSSSEC